MPIMIYRLLRDALERFGRPVTTRELTEHVHVTIPMCTDHVPDHLSVLARYDLVKRKLDKGQKAFVWWIEKPYYSEAELAEKYPGLFLESLYYHVVSDELAGEPIPLDYIIELLYEISGGSEKRPTIPFIRKILRRLKEAKTDLFKKLVNEIKKGAPPRGSQVLVEVKKLLKEKI